MEKRAFIDALKELTANENILAVGKEVNALRTQFEDYLLEATRQHQIAELDAKEKGEELTNEDWITPLKEEFYAIFSPYQEKRKALIVARYAEQEENLRKKQQLITQLKNVIAEEENIGAAFSAHKEINEKWKRIGDIPRDKRNDIQQEYSRLLETFFYNINIYKEIKDYDFKKNFEAKKAIVEQLKALSEVDKIKKVEATLKQLQNEWEDIGPIKQDLWEELKDEYWSTVNAIYSRIRDFYDARREKMQENILQKKALIQKMETVLAKKIDTVKSWNNHTKKVLDYQKEWKTIGFGPKKENEEIWKIFRSLCDDFFARKSAFFKEAQQEFDEVALKKKVLIDRVNELKESTDWDATTKAIIDLQKEWKKTGNAGQKHEQSLWKAFRAACDYFFEAKQALLEEKEKAFENNLKEKEALISEISAFQLPSESQAAIKALYEFSQRYLNIGFVPEKKKNEVFNAYKAALSKHYDALDLPVEEKEKIEFELKINILKASENSAELFKKEKQAIRNSMNAIQQEIIQFENNLGFFAHSKGANALKEQVENNIAAEQKKLLALKAKLKMIPNE